MNYLKQFQGRFIGIMKWEDFETFWKLLKNQSNDWFFYDLTTKVPTQKINIHNDLNKIHNIIKELHQERYCGIVYSDDLQQPTMVKIFHPKNLGKSCGSSKNPPLPQWVISKIKPIDLSYLLPKEKTNWLSKFFK
ncbi:hypothetical protein MNB_SUP05-5-844 [hydrothermal vent metagenome]|uniref:Uncharacterized protein n=1 Tax=hydrothermal vent metagenome TaxID=652676 RepID=A0A1W1BEC6_9ZZZZ